MHQLEYERHRSFSLIADWHHCVPQWSVNLNWSHVPTSGENALYNRNMLWRFRKRVWRMNAPKIAQYSYLLPRFIMVTQKFLAAITPRWTVIESIPVQSIVVPSDAKERQQLGQVGYHSSTRTFDWVWNGQHAQAYHLRSLGLCSPNTKCT